MFNRGFKKQKALHPSEVRGWHTTLKAHECLVLSNGLKIFNPESRQVKICFPDSIQLAEATNTQESSHGKKNRR